MFLWLKKDSKWAKSINKKTSSRNKPTRIFDVMSNYSAHSFIGFNSRQHLGLISLEPVICFIIEKPGYLFGLSLFPDS